MLRTSTGSVVIRYLSNRVYILILFFGYSDNPKAEYQNRTGDERLETFSFASKLIPQDGSGGTRTPDQFIRSELLYPSELLTHVVVPIAANPELPRRSPQLISQPLYYKGCLHPCQAFVICDLYW